RGGRLRQRRHPAGRPAGAGADADELHGHPHRRRARPHPRRVPQGGPQARRDRAERAARPPHRAEQAVRGLTARRDTARRVPTAPGARPRRPGGLSFGRLTHPRPMETPAVAPYGLKIYPVTSARDRKRFLDFPYRHYAGSRYFVPPLRADQEKTLDPKKNPFFEHGRIQLFLAEDGRGAVVGRVAAIVSGMHLAKYDDDVGFFGFFEAIEDYAVAEALLDAATGWLRDGGLRAVRGPVNPTINDVAGLLVEGFDRPPSILMPYNKPYYEDFLLRYGFERAMTMFAYYVHDAYLDADRPARGAAVGRRRHPSLRVRTLDMRRYMDEALLAHEIYNEAWSGNWGSVPMTDAEFRHLANDLKQIIEPDLVVFVEVQDEAGRWEPVAFSVSIPNLNQAIRHLK